MRYRGVYGNGAISRLSKEEGQAIRPHRLANSPTDFSLLSAPRAPIQDKIYLPVGILNQPLERKPLDDCHLNQR